MGQSEINEECGICGVSVKENAPQLIYKMLIQMQHRGQLSAGITTFHPHDPQILKTHKDLGLVNNVFRAEHKGKFNSIMANHASSRAIGHVRYATSGVDDAGYAQPFEHRHGKKNRWFSFCFNGNISNYAELKSWLKKQNYHLIHETDTEVIQHLLSKAIKETSNFKKSFYELSQKLDGAYNIAFMNAEGTIIAARDPLGFKPLCYSIMNGELAFASESVALSSIGFTDIVDLPPGHLIIKEGDDIRIEKYCDPKRKAHCFFEWIYFAHAASKIDGHLVYEVRRKLGTELAKLETQKIGPDCVAVAVPNSSTPAGDGFAEALNIPFREGLIRNRYIGRTFIESKNRGEKVKDKFTVIPEVVEGKRVFLIEDSIVRGTTLKNLIEYIRRVGKPKEIHVRVSCPPIKWPCFYGIDMSSKKELIAAREEDYKKMVAGLEKELGADSIIYQTIPNLVKSIGFEEKDLCLACLNGNYPTDCGNRLKHFDKECRACESIKK